MATVCKPVVRKINSGQILARIIIGFVLILAISAGLAIMFRQESQMARIRQRHQTLTATLAEASMDLDELRELQSLVDTDAYIERVAREQLGMVRPNEIIFMDN